MKRNSIALGLLIMLGSSVIFPSCNEKKKAPEKTPVKTEETAKAPETAPALDTAVAEEADTTASTTSTSAASTDASAQKFGHINSADLIQLMPEVKRADASLETYVKSLEGKMGNLQNDYRRKVTEYQSQEKTMVDAVKESKIKAIQELEMQLQQGQADGQQKIAAKREALYKPILDKAEKAVKAVGKENGYDYIFDTNAGSFIYAKDSHDIMPLVKKKLGIK
jgi:outer membrane protein